MGILLGPEAGLVLYLSIHHWVSLKFEKNN